MENSIINIAKEGNALKYQKPIDIVETKDEILKRIQDNTDLRATHTRERDMLDGLILKATEEIAQDEMLLDKATEYGLETQDEINEKMKVEVGVKEEAVLNNIE